MFKKLILASAVVAFAGQAMAHPVNEPHTAENILKHYGLEVPVKEVIVEKEVIKEVPNKANFTDYLGGAISANYITKGKGGDVFAEDLGYVEGELWAGKGNVHFYGFWDVNDDDSHFYKLNPKWFVGGGNVFANYTQKGFIADGGTSSTDHFTGVGYRFSTGAGFIDASLNSRHSDNEFSGQNGTNGYAVLFNGVHQLGNNWQVDGWTDVMVGQEEEFNESEYEIRGNIGIRKSFPEFHNVYVRVAPHFFKDENDSDIAVHTQIGVTF